MAKKHRDKDWMGKRAETLKVMAHEQRLAILNELVNVEEMSVSSIQAAVGIAQSPTSQHLAKMRAAGVVKARREGTTIYYSIACSEMQELVNALLAS